MWASVLSFLTCSAFALLASALHLRILRSALMAGLAIWIMVPVPVGVVNGLFLKISPGLLVSQILGWLIKLAIAASVFALIAKYVFLRSESCLSLESAVRSRLKN